MKLPTVAYVRTYVWNTNGAVEIQDYCNWTETIYMCLPTIERAICMLIVHNSYIMTEIHINLRVATYIRKSSNSFCKTSLNRYRPILINIHSSNQIFILYSSMHCVNITYVCKYNPTHHVIVLFLCYHRNVNKNWSTACYYLHYWLNQFNEF